MVDNIVSEFIKQNYHDSQVDVVGVKDIRIRDAKAIGMRKIAMKARHLHYKFIPDEFHINVNQGQCCLDYIMFEMTQVWTKYTRQDLIHDLGEECVIFGVTTERILQWASEKKYISVFALDPFGQVFDSVLAIGHTSLVLTFLVNNDHCYPITDPAMKQQVARSKQPDFGSVRFNLYSIYLKEYDVTCPAKVLFIETDDLSYLVKQIIETKGFIPVHVSCRGALVDAFEHPVTGQLIIFGAQL